MSLKLNQRIAVTAVALAATVFCVLPASARHKESPVTNIFTAPPDQVVSTPVFVSGNGKPIINKPVEEPRWDNVKSLPDIKPEQMKALNKLQEQYNKTIATIRNESSDAQQKLKNLKEHKPALTSLPHPEVPFNLMTPDGKPYIGPLLGDQSLAMMPGVENGEESVDDVQARIDSLKQETSELNKSNDAQLKALLTSDQINELELMRQGKLVIKEQKDMLADARTAAAKPPGQSGVPGASSTGKASNGNNSGSAAGAKILNRVLRSSARGLIYRAARGGF